MPLPGLEFVIVASSILAATAAAGQPYLGGRKSHWRWISAVEASELCAGDSEPDGHCNNQRLSGTMISHGFSVLHMGAPHLRAALAVGTLV